MPERQELDSSGAAHSRHGDIAHTDAIRITPSGVLALRAPGARDLTCASLLGSGDLRAGKVSHHRPQKADELTGDGDHGDLWPLAIGEMLIPLM